MHAYYFFLERISYLYYNRVKYNVIKLLIVQKNINLYTNCFQLKNCKFSIYLKIKSAHGPFRGLGIYMYIGHITGPNHSSNDLDSLANCRLLWNSTEIDQLQGRYWQIWNLLAKTFLILFLNHDILIWSFRNQNMREL